MNLSAVLDGHLWTAISGTLVLWATSGTLAVFLGLVFAAGALNARVAWRIVSLAAISLSRGVPTSILVIGAGLAMVRLHQIPALPHIYPGTPASFQHIAWGIVIALGAGSAGHLAEIFRAARANLGRYRLEQATVLGLSPLGQVLLLAREAASIALPPTGARLVHHLHNTAFAALFPVTDLFGYVQGEATATYRVVEFAIVGCGIYVALTALTWMLFRGLEAGLVPPRVQPAGRGVVAWSRTS